jgi:hypothetical protein
MAIDFHNSYRREIDHLVDRARMARSRDEHDYYLGRARELERELSMRDARYFEPPRMMPLPAPTSFGVDLAKSEAPALAFLNSANKLLLVGDQP